MLRRGAPGLLYPGQIPQPVGLRINFAHPLAQGLQSLVLPAGGGSVIDLAKPRRGAGGTNSLRRRGLTVNGAWSLAAASTLDCNFTTPPWTVAAVGYLPSVPGTTSYLFSRSNFVNSGNNVGWVLYYDSATFNCAILNNNAIGSYQLASSGVTVAGGDWTLAMSTDGTTRRFYINGTLNGSSTGLNLTAASATTFNMSNNFSDTTFELGVGACWSRTLSDSEMRQFHYDPLCMTTSLFGDDLPYVLHVDVFRPGGMFAMFPP